MARPSLEWHRGIDCFPAAQYVQKLAEALLGETTRWGQWIRRRLLERGGLKRVVEAATSHYQRQTLGRNADEPYQTAYQPLRQNRRRVNYCEQARLGLLSGSPVTKALCKTVCAPCFKQSGMKGEDSGARAAVRPRVVVLSGTRNMARIDPIGQVSQTDGHGSHRPDRAS